MHSLCWQTVALVANHLLDLLCHRPFPQSLSTITQTLGNTAALKLHQQIPNLLCARAPDSLVQLEGLFPFHGFRHAMSAMKPVDHIPLDILHEALQFAGHLLFWHRVPGFVVL